MVTNEQDMNNAFEIWSAISEPQELNLSPYVYDIYLNVLVPLWQEKYESSISTGPIGITKNEILRKYYDVFRKPLGEQKLRKEIISMLNQAGLIYEEADPGDKRVSLIFQCLMKKTEE